MHHVIHPQPLRLLLTTTCMWLQNCTASQLLKLAVLAATSLAFNFSVETCTDALPFLVFQPNGYLSNLIVRPTLTIFTAMIVRMRYELASTCQTYRYIQTYIQKYSDFLISVGLAQARPNQAFDFSVDQIFLCYYNICRCCWSKIIL